MLWHSNLYLPPIHFEISGITFDGPPGQSGIWIRNTTNMIISNASFINAAEGIYISNSAVSNIRIENSIIANNAFEGIATDGTNIVIVGNTITGNALSGISAVNATIESNTITGNGTDIVVYSGYSPDISLNKLDTITGAGAIGQFNRDSGGNPKSLP